MPPTVSSGKQHHIACGKGDLAEYLLVLGAGCECGCEKTQKQETMAFLFLTAVGS